LHRSESEHLSALIGTIYDAALDLERWPQALEGARDFVGGQVANIYWHDSVRPVGNNFCQIGISPEWERSYFETYLPLNPLQPYQIFCPIEEVHAGSEFMPFEEFSKTRFYREWAAPQGLVDATFANLERLPTSSVGFSIMRGERHGLVDAEARRRMTLVVPHIRRAALISKAIDLAQVREATFTTAMDALTSGMFLLDAAGCIIHTNASGAAMIDSSGPVRLVNGRFELVSRASDQLFQEALTVAAGDPIEMHNKAVSLPITDSSERDFTLHMLPLDLKRRARLGADRGATVLVFVRSMDSTGAAAIAAFAAKFALTRQEARVLRAVIDTGSVPMAAALLGVSATTARFHLTGIFDKTGVRTQSGLIRLLIEGASPFAGS
jgi:DNA-binding CsgD family transcriptional regulator/PAS domain-containing protein